MSAGSSISRGGKPIILFAHGAGAPSRSAWMQAWARRLAAFGDVMTFDYPYMAAGRKSPDRMPKLVEAHAAALEAARGEYGRDRPVVLAGKSMGSRVGCHLAVEATDHVDPASAGRAPDALVCFGYPLRSGATGALRDEVLRALRTPILFLQGTRDALCPLEDLAVVRAAMPALNELFVVEGGNHSLEAGVRDLRSRGLTQADSDAAVSAAIGRFLSSRGLAP